MGTVIKEKEVIYSEKFEKWIPKNKLVNYFHKLEQENQELKNELKCTEFKNLVLAKKLGEVKKENQELKKLLGLEKEWTQNNAGVITDFSNAPYNNMLFKDINEVGKQWIKKYGLALCKELLGTIRSKYASLPIPNAETTLDGDTLRTEASTEKEVLITQLREMLEQTSRRALLEADKDEAEYLNEKLAKVPYPIYIG